MTGSSAPQPTSYMFIDGECLSQVVATLSNRYFAGEQPLALDWAKVRGSHRKVFYYDAIPVQMQGEPDGDYAARVEPKRRELEEIEKQSGFHIKSGDVRHRKGRGNEQKMVDVQLAVDALIMAGRGLFSTVTLLTGDLDFKPLVSALVDLGVDVRVQYPRGKTNAELLAAADQADPLTINTMLGWCRAQPEVRARLPLAVFQFKSASDFDQSTICCTDPGFGRVSIKRDSAGQWVLRTETCPSNPTAHCLVITATDRQALCLYAQDIFDLSVPEKD